MTRLGRCVALAMVAATWPLAAAAQQPQPADPGRPPAAQGPAAQGPGPVAPPPVAPTPGGPFVKPFEPRPILPPADPSAAAAHAVLERHCSRCHQGGRLDRSAPAAAFGNVLRLDELAHAPHLVQPGNPDASRLYQMMLRRQMPFDVHRERASLPAPNAADLDAVRTWIAGLAPRSVCRDRRFITAGDQAVALAQVAAANAAVAHRLRFVSLAHLHNACTSFEALAAYRLAVVRIFNSLSWKPAPIAVTAVDAARTLFRVNLDDLGWLPEHWERIMRGGGDLPSSLVVALPPAATEPFGTSLPVARADWFADNGLAAPLYYDVLGLPGTGPEILRILSAMSDGATAAGAALRVGMKPSRFSVLPSLVERQGSLAGSVWHAFHKFAEETGADLAAEAEKPVGEPVSHQVRRSLFSLPNGLPAFFVVGGRGDRLDNLPPAVALPSHSDRGEMRSGLGCLGCHAGGPAARDMAGLPAAATAAIASDRAAVADALRRIGVDPAVTLDGVDPVVALAREHARPVDVQRAAAELGTEPHELVRIASGGEDPSAVLARRLVQGLVARAEFERRAGLLVSALGRRGPETAQQVSSEGKSTATPLPVAASSEPVPLDPGPSLILLSDKPVYQKGDPLQLTVRVAQDCHLTVISIDRRGRATVLFPSDFESNALVRAGQELRLPGPSAAYVFRLNEVGREQVAALCNEAGPSTDGIRHDFERQRFTDLGNYSAFLSQAYAKQGASAPAVESRRPEARPRGRRRTETAQPDPPATPAQIGRTAITVVVE